MRNDPTVKADTVCFGNHCVSWLFNLCMYFYCTRNIFVYCLVSLYYVDVYCVALSLTLPHKSSSLWDPTTQTMDGYIHSAEPPLFLPSGFTPHLVVTAWAHSMKAENRSVSLLSEAGPACKMLTSIKSL